MKRRNFLLGAGVAATGAALPLAVSAARRPALLDDPRAWLGEEFVSDEGLRLRLTQVEAVRVDRDTMQADLHFEVLQGEFTAAGIQALRCGRSENPLYLQPGATGAVACINRLRRARG